VSAVVVVVVVVVEVDWVALLVLLTLLLLVELLELLLALLKQDVGRLVAWLLPAVVVRAQSFSVLPCTINLRFAFEKTKSHNQ